MEGIIPHQRRSYDYDLTGNRDSTTLGTAAPDQATTGYTPNLNQQYTAIAHPRFVEITGEAPGIISISLDNVPAPSIDRTQIRYVTSDPNSFRYPHTFTHTEARWLKVDIGSVTEGGSSSRTGFIFLPPATETLLFDDDGNLSEDARWNYTWDAENRLTSMTEKVIAAASGITAPLRKKLSFAYDYKNRRIAKKVEVEEGNTWRIVKDLRFVYDGVHMIAELDHTFATGTGLAGSKVLRTYLWGPDLSGTMTGAGGTGGLLCFTDHLDGTTYHVCNDANGNITGLVPANGVQAGQLIARFDYDPFGNRITNTGPNVELCPFGFSSQYTDSETGLVSYLYRYYSPQMGRFLSSDPLGGMAFRQMQMQAHGSTAFGDLIASKLTANEREQLESPYGEDVDWTSAFIPSVESGLYRFAGNNPISMIDILGLLEYWMVEGNYPNYGTYPTETTADNSIWKFVGGKVQQNGEASIFTNSCAIRMSHALNASGVMVTSASGAVSSGKNPPKWWYLYRVENMKTFLQTKLGAPQIFTPAEFKKNCMKGIVVFEIQFSDATGHVTLWDGSTTIDNSDHDIDASRRILFWELGGN